MDFAALLEVATKNNVLNEKLGTKTKTGYNTALAPAKRQAPSRPKGVLSANVKAFLDKQAQEEKAKVKEEQKKKEALVKKRQDLKNKQAAAKKNHGANSLEAQWEEKERERIVKEQLEEKRRAIIEKLKEDETKGGKRAAASSSVASSLVPEYVSERQRKADRKLMEKYDKGVDSSDEEEIKCDVLSPSKQILDKAGYEKRQEARRKELEKQYKLKPGARMELLRSSAKQKSSGGGGSSSSSSKHKDKHKDKHRDKHSHKHKDKHKDKHKEGKEEKVERKMVPKKPKFIRPNNNRPVLSFQDLLNMASKKQSKALGTETSPVAPSSAPPKEKPPKNGRPMTQEEKDRYARRQTKEYKDWLKNGGKLQIGKSQPPESDSDDEPKRSSNHERTQRPDKPNSSSSSSSTTMPSSVPKKSEQGSSRPSDNVSGSSSKSKNQMRPPASSSSSSSLSSTRKEEKMPPLAGKKRDADGSVKKQEPPKDAFSNPFDRIMGGIRKDHPKKEKRPRVIESDEEDYEEMDDFIDDDQEDDDFIDDSEAQDYSSIIRNMFKYNPNKYKDEDEDLRSMETGFAQISAEERRSAKIGLKEDLEDIRREKEEERRKMLLKKKMKLKMKGR